MLSFVEWVSRNFFYGLGTIMIGVLFAAVVYGRSAESMILSIPAVIIFGVMILLSQKRKARSTFEAKLLEVSSILQSNPERATRGIELYISAAYYQRRAANSSTAALLVLLLLAVSVAFAGYILNLDTVQFSSLSRYAIELDSRRDVIRSISRDDKIAPEIKAQALSDLRPIQDEYQKALSAQTGAEASMAGPTYRIASAIVIRISILGVGIYLVVLLNRAYKFNSSLSSFYQSRFLSCLRGDEDMEDFAKFATLVSAETIDYKTDIEHPADRLVVIFDKISNMFARDKSNRKNN